MALSTIAVFLLVSPILKAIAVNAGCECVIFDDTYGKEYGVFTSPNWPIPYHENIDCLLYTFIGNENEIVELIFDEFDVQKSNLDCIFGDFVKLFLHLPDPSVNENVQWNTVLCGKVADIDQIHYSSQNNLIFEFHSDWQRGNNTGFRGTYRFLNQDLFQTNGDLIHGSVCNYQFISGNVSLNRGRFYSPQYPSTYPQHVRCSYQFAGKSNERVKVVFEQIQLQKGDVSCLNSPDVIVVHDGKDTASPVIGHLCNTNTYVELVSTGPDLFIEFVSRSHFPGQGFKASFAFETESLRGIPFIHTEPEGFIREELSTTEPLVLIGDYAVGTQCDQWVTSDMQKNGTIASPNYPGPYPAKIQCTYHFTGRGKERVQLLFSDFELYKPEESGKDCDGVDVVTVFVTINGQKERIDNFCGSRLPAPLMSNGPNMIVEFKGIQSSSLVRGFQAIYRFVTDFGITTGMQDPLSVCGFLYNSSIRTNGTFMSPNWPGYYPRDSECHYFFYGHPHERIHITFAYFDIEGVLPCTTDTASDYVEFSNFRSVDRKLPRHCGLKKPEKIASEGDFFRVTFKSNDRFDGTGFEAFYQFRNTKESTEIKRVRSGAKTSQGFPQFSPALITWCLLLLRSLGA